MGARICDNCRKKLTNAVIPAIEPDIDSEEEYEGPSQLLDSTPTPSLPDEHHSSLTFQPQKLISNQSTNA